MITEPPVTYVNSLLDKSRALWTERTENRRILVIDDNPSIHDDFRKILCSQSGSPALEEKASLLFGDSAPRATIKDYDVDTASQGVEGLQMMAAASAEGRPYSIAFVDVRMPPGLDGMETIQQAVQIDPNLQLVLCTAYSDYTAHQVVGQIGPTDRLLFLRKPFDAVAVHLLACALTEKWRLTAQVNSLVKSQQSCITRLDRVVKLVESEKDELAKSHSSLTAHSDELSRRLQERTIEILGTRDVAVFALAQLAESRDPETGDHLIRMRDYAQILAEYLAHDSPYAREIGTQFLQDLQRSTPLHDIGKVGIPDNVLLKPGRLTATEFEVMKQHTEIGAQALERTASTSPFGSFLHMAAEIARHHHEQFDGSGYPTGLIGHEIPLAARLAALADVFDALTSKRVYKDATDVVEAREIIVAKSGSHFDPEVVKAFEACFESFVEVKAAVAAGTER